MAMIKETKFSMVTNETPEYPFGTLVFHNSKTKAFRKGFNLQCKYNFKLNPYFMFIRLDV